LVAAEESRAMNKEKSVFRIILVLSIIIALLVVVLNERVIPAPDNYPAFINHLPKVHALLNGICFVLLLFSYRAIRAGKIAVHKKINLTAFGLSALFLLSYVTYHYLAGDTKFGGTGTIKSIYFVVLISHIVLAAVVLPLVLWSFYLGLKDQRSRHKKVVRWSFPVWLYVTLTGVVVYLMLSPYYTN
jgi:putative membrane protein